MQVHRCIQNYVEDVAMLTVCKVEWFKYNIFCPQYKWVKQLKPFSMYDSSQKAAVKVNNKKNSVELVQELILVIF